MNYCSTVYCDSGCLYVIIKHILEVCWMIRSFHRPLRYYHLLSNKPFICNDWYVCQEKQYALTISRSLWDQITFPRNAKNYKWLFLVWNVRYNVHYIFKYEENMHYNIHLVSYIFFWNVYAFMWKINSFDICGSSLWSLSLLFNI